MNSKKAQVALGYIMMALMFIVVFCGVVWVLVETVSEMKEDAEYLETCHKYTVTNIISASAGGFGAAPQYVYDTTGGRIISSKHMKIGGRMCLNE